MTIDERSALAITAIRALEIADRSRELWSEADRAWASRAAAEVVGEGAPADAFLARRATLAFERVGERYPPLARAARAIRWRRSIGIGLVVLAFVAGIAIDRVGAGQRINLLAPPVLALLAWNLAVYLLLAIGPFLRGRRWEMGPVRRAVARLAGGLGRLPTAGGGALGAAIASFGGEWARLAAPLYASRTARILHFAAAALAAGVVAGLYLRGLVLDYRASWESTFLGADTVHRILSLMLAPGALVTGIAIPPVEALDALRAGATATPGSAAPWLHLVAATVAVVVVVPRLLLGVIAWAIEQRRATHFALAQDEPYFQRVLRGFHGGPVRVKVVPYSYQVPAASLAGLQAVVSRAFGGSAAMVCASPVLYGDEDALPASALPDGSGPAIALFNLAATPEREAHGAFVTAMRQAAGTHPVIVLIDEASFRERNAGDPSRFEQRRGVWRAMFAPLGIAPAFADLRAPDLAAIELAVEAALEPRREAAP